MEPKAALPRLWAPVCSRSAIASPILAPIRFHRFRRCRPAAALITDDLQEPRQSRSWREELGLHVTPSERSRPFHSGLTA